MKESSQESGFAAVEIVLLLVAVATIVGVGLWVHKQGTTAYRSSEKNSSQPVTKIDEKIGTLSAVDAVNKKDVDDEIKAEDELSAEEQKNAQADEEAFTNTGDGYETNF